MSWISQTNRCHILYKVIIWSVCYVEVIWFGCSHLLCFCCKCGLSTGQHYMSQNHRMVGVERDLWGSSSPIPLPKQGDLQQAAQDVVQVGFEYLQRRRLHNLPGQSVPVLWHPLSKEVLPRVQLKRPMLQSVPVAPCPVAGHHWKESGPILLTPSLQIFIGIYKHPLSALSSSGWTSPDPSASPGRRDAPVPSSSS